ncbi:RagB/SusD family nutrient uptake outer membrane protein [Sphingobacterium thalpophilum]|uniref:RagB/SusD family nutrient uptake outer membrane protein n=1 Tax=Sphingobacterium thalpophilum TaxID=259 RepID=UPI003DA5776D
MKRYRKVLFIPLIAFMVLSIGSCNKDLLNREPLDIISSEVVFKDENLSLKYLSNLYDFMPVGFGLHISDGNQILSGLGITDLLDGSTDLLRSPASWNESNSVMIPGLISATYNPLDVWARNYRGIRVANNILYGLSTSPLNEGFRNRVSAEARFVRAFLYFDLVRRYGDVPLITALQNFDDQEELYPKRTPKGEVYDFIDQELSAVADILPAKAEFTAGELGRASKEAAWALNGRVLLFAERYERSALYSAKVIEGNAYILEPDYNKLFQSYGGNDEVIFEVMFNGTNKGHAFDNLFLPPSIDNGWGSQTLPTQEMVDSYEMLNGRMITDPQSGYDAQDPYIDRDKRFYASIVYNGSTLKGKVINTGYLQPDDGLNLTERTITGYYIRKFIDETLPFGELRFGGSKTSWKELRLGEVLLNFAEAQNHVSGPNQAVYDAINRIREIHGGLPVLPSGLSKEDMFKRIVQERKVELAFEGHRFWDLRRWKMAEEVLNDKYFHGMKITEENGQKKYEVFELRNVPKQVFLPKHYLMPISLGELTKNTNLVPNPNY